MTPTVTPEKTLKGRIVGYVARVAGVEARGSTPKDARAACESAVRARLQALSDGTQIGRFADHLYVVMPDQYGAGWAYWIDTFQTATPETGWTYVISGCPTQADAIREAISHITQIAGDHVPEVPSCI